MDYACTTMLGAYGLAPYGLGTGSVVPARAAPPPDAKPALGPADAGSTYATASYGSVSLLGYGPRPASNVGTYLKCLVDPTVANALEYGLGPIKATKPRLAKRDDTPAEWVEFVERVTRPLWAGYAASAVWSVMLGWAGWEVVWARRDGRYVVEDLLPCEQAGSGILVTDDRVQMPVGVTTQGVELYGHKALHLTYDVDGARTAFGWGRRHLGRSRLENVLDACHQSKEADDSTGKLFTKARGVTAGVGYTPGNVQTEGGQTVDRGVVAKRFAEQLASGAGYFAYPLLGAGITDEVIARLIDRPGGAADLAKLLELSLWQFKQIDMGEVGTAVSSVIEEKTRLDRLKCLGLFVPPEAILMGDGGNRAKTEAAGGFGTAMNEPVNALVVAGFNRLVDGLLALNFGPKARGAVWYDPEPLEDPQAVLDRQILTAAMQGNGPWSEELFRRYDLGAIAERWGIPKRPELKPGDRAGRLAMVTMGAVAKGAAAKDLVGADESLRIMGYDERDVARLSAARDAQAADDIAAGVEADLATPADGEAGTGPAVNDPSTAPA